MIAADKTIDFVKQWIAGTYTKRQYQNYYIVKTPNGEFLMKSTETKDLVAIRDHSGHIYLFDSELRFNSFEPTIDKEASCMSNPFLCLLRDDFKFPYTRVAPESVQKQQNLMNTISKWKVLDRVEITNTRLLDPIYMSLIEVGDSRYCIAPEMEDSGEGWTGGLLPWARYSYEANFKFRNLWPVYRLEPVHSNKIGKISEIRDSLVAFAGEHAEKSVVSKEGWIFIPTTHKTLADLTGLDYKAAKKTRPNPFAYNLIGGNVNIGSIYRRFETIADNANALKACLNIRDDVASDTWRQQIQDKFLPELAEECIEFFELDDLWLTEHAHIAEAGSLEAMFRAKVGMAVNGLLFVKREENPSVLSNYVVYAKDRGANVFVKVLPSPKLSRMKGIFSGST